MPPRVLADSEDEDEDDFSPRKHLTQSKRTGSRETIKAQSTGSTERVRAQIRLAESDLITENMSTVLREDSPSGLKRRHSELATQPSHATHSTPHMKRIKSSGPATLSSGLLSPSLQRTTAVSSRSSPHAMAFVPPASLSDTTRSQEDLTLFGQTGDTIPFNTAEHQLAIDITRNGRSEATKQPCERSTAPMIEPRSSSVLLTASQLYKSPMDGIATQERIHNGYLAVDASTQDLIAEHADSHERENIVYGITPEVASRDMQASQTSESSAIVVLTKPTRTRAKVAQPSPQTTEEPISSQTAIGLPKEQYVPRPSKRRAKPLAEVPDINEVNPNEITQTSKSKKTAKSSKSKKNDQPRELVLDDQEEIVDSSSSAAVAIVQSSTTDEAQRNGGTATPMRGQDEDDELALSHHVVRTTSSTSSKSRQSRSKQTKKTMIFTDAGELPDTQVVAQPTVLKEVKNEASGRSKGRTTAIVDSDDELATDSKTVFAHKKQTPVKTPVKDPPSSAQREKLRLAQPLPIEHQTSIKDPEPVLIEDDEELSETKEMVSSSPAKDVPMGSATHATIAKIVEPRQATEPKLARSVPSTLQTGAPMRVGLSKRNRIPSLLKIVRPAKKL